MIEYGEARDRFFRAVNDHPENIDLIAHNAAAVLLTGIAWPEGFDVEKQATAIEAFFIEFWRRWQFAKVRTSTEKNRPND